MVAAHISRVWAAYVGGARRPFFSLGSFWLFHELEQMGTFHAIPVAVRNSLETYAVCMVGGIAAVAQE